MAVWTTVRTISSAHFRIIEGFRITHVDPTWTLAELHWIFINDIPLQ